MVDTNALITIGFALIQQFTNVVHLPPEWVATRQADLAEARVGEGPRRPTSLTLVHRNGSIFWIYDGSVREFRAPGSYSFLQNPRAISNYVGQAVIKPDEAEKQMRNTLRILAKNAVPLDEWSLQFGPEDVYHGTPLPIYFGRWFATNDPGLTG